MIHILINNKPTQLLTSPPNEVYSLTITNLSMVPRPIPNTHTKAVQEWLYNITQSVINQITYNGTIIAKEDITIPLHMKKETT